MPTLMTNPCAGALERLFAEAEASDARLDEWTGALPATDRSELMAGAGDFRQFYRRLKDFHLAVSRSTASLLYILARSSRAKAIIEFGTSFGVSTLHLGRPKPGVPRAGPRAGRWLPVRSIRR
jgi:predicted O-methyltransferase YrrM